MYHPIIKNKLNDLKGLKNVDTSLAYMPILELVDTKIEDLQQFITVLTDGDKASLSIKDVVKEKQCFIDVPTYLDNEIVNTYNLHDSDEKFKFFISLKHRFTANSFKDFIPVISFNHDYDTPRKSYKENINFAKQIIDSFDNFAIRLFGNSLFKNDDYTLLWQLYDFYGKKIEDNATLIFDIDTSTKDLAKNLIKEIKKEFEIKNIILSGEVLKEYTRDGTPFDYDRLSNAHLTNYFGLIKDLANLNLPCNYSDYTLSDKIPSKLDVDPEKGFLYYPFIKYTTEDGKLCMFTADAKGNYQQYQELCKRVVAQMKNFSSEHCSTCNFIYEVATSSEPDSISYKGGSVWKHRMIAHHITSMSLCPLI